MSTWTPAFPLGEIDRGGARLLRHDGHQVAVFRLEDDQLHAVDNLCPHEGYPLVQGALSAGKGSNCTLTCAWHNWKFDLRDGSCLKGGEGVRTFPVRVRDGQVELDLSPPDPALERARLWSSLDQALDDHDTGRAARDAVRLLQAVVPAAEIAAAAAAFDGARAEYGATHALPVAADVLRLLSRYPGAQAAIPLAQALDVASYNNARRPQRPLAAPEDPGADPVAASLHLAQRVEAEDAAGAEALLRGALARGWRRAQLEPTFIDLCSAHFLSFGHRLIYTTKVFDLLDEAGWQHAEPILCGHLFGIVNGTREDVLPGWKPWRAQLEQADLVALHAVAPDPTWDPAALIDTLIDERPREAVAATIAALAAGAPRDAVATALSLASAERLLRFDVAIDSDQGVQDNWLSVTHIQTFSAAVRLALRRHDVPDTLRLVLQAARFVSHHGVLDGERARTAPLAGTLGDLRTAILHKDSRAVGLAAGAPKGMADLLLDLAIADSTGAPIVQAHVLKNTLVGIDEARETGDPRPVLAVVRLLSSPLQQRWIQRGALEAVNFVTEGRKPRVLAP